MATDRITFTPFPRAEDDVLVELDQAEEVPSLFEQSEFIPPPLESALPPPVPNKFFPPPLDSALPPPDEDERGFWEQRKDSTARGMAMGGVMGNVLGAAYHALALSGNEERIATFQDALSEEALKWEETLERDVAQIDRTKYSEEEIEEFKSRRRQQLAKTLQDRADRNREGFIKEAQGVAHWEEVRQAIQPSETMLEIAEAEGVGETVKLMFQNPEAFLDLSLESAVPSAMGMLGTVGGAAVGGIPGMMVGGGIGVMAPEIAARMQEVMNEQGVDLTNPKQVEEFLQDPKKRAEAISKGVRKGLGIGVTEFFFQGLGGRFLRPALKAATGKPVKIAAAGALEGAIQTIGEGAGEAVGGLVSGAGLDGKDIVLEMGGAGPQVATTVLAGTAVRIDNDQRAIRQQAEALAQSAMERADRAGETARTAQAAQRDNLNVVSSVGMDLVENPPTRLSADDVAAVQRRIHETTSQGIQNQEEIELTALEAFDEIEKAGGELQLSSEIETSPQAQELDQAAQDMEQLIMYFETSLELDQTDPELGAMMRHPDAALLFEQQKSRLPGNTFIEIENSDGTRVPALFSGYYMENTPAIGNYDPDLNSWSHGAGLKPGQKIVTPIPSFSQWEQAEAQRVAEQTAAQEQAMVEEERRVAIEDGQLAAAAQEEAIVEGEDQIAAQEAIDQRRADAFQEPGTEDVPTDQPPGSVQPVEEEIRDADQADQQTQAQAEVRQRIRGLAEESRAIVEANQGRLTTAQAKKYRTLQRQIADLRFDFFRPVNPANVASPQERQSTLPVELVVQAFDDARSNREAYIALFDAASGVGFNQATAVDEILEGKNPNLSAPDFYQLFDRTRQALRDQYGDTITLYRAESGRQRKKPTQNWATTEEFARQFGENIITQQVPIENVIAVNVSPNGTYHELIVGTPPVAPSTQKEVFIPPTFKNVISVDKAGRTRIRRVMVDPGTKRPSRRVSRPREIQIQRRLAKIPDLPEGERDLLMDVRDFGGVPAPSRNSNLGQGGEYNGFRENLQGLARFLIITDANGSKFGRGDIDTWLQEFNDQTKYQFDIPDFYEAIFTAQQKRKEKTQQMMDSAKRDKVETLLSTGRRRRKRDQSTRPVNTATLMVGDRFKVEGETFIVTGRDPRTGEVEIQDGITMTLPNNEEMYPDKKTMRRVKRDVDGNPFFDAEALALQATEEAEARPEIEAAEAAAFQPPPLDSALPPPTAPIEERRAVLGDREGYLDAINEEEAEGASVGTLNRRLAIAERNGWLSPDQIEDIRATQEEFGTPTDATTGFRALIDAMGEDLNAAEDAGIFETDTDTDFESGFEALRSGSREQFDQINRGERVTTFAHRLGLSARTVEEVERLRTAAQSARTDRIAANRIAEQTGNDADIQQGIDLQIREQALNEAFNAAVGIDNAATAAEELGLTRQFALNDAGEVVPLTLAEDAGEFTLDAQTPEDINTERENLRQQAERRRQREEMQARAEAPLTPRREQIDVAQGEMFAADETLFSGETLEEQTTPPQETDPLGTDGAQRWETDDTGQTAFFEEEGEYEIDRFEEVPALQPRSIQRKLGLLRPGVAEILPVDAIRELTDDQLTVLNRGTAARLAMLWRETPSQRELRELAEFAEEGRYWYDDYEAILRDLNATPERKMRLSAVIAAYSPNKAVSQNIRMAMETLVAWERAGRPTNKREIGRILDNLSFYVQPSDRPNVVVGLTAPNARSAIRRMSVDSPKVKQFLRALMGDQSSVTIDTHIARLFGLAQKMIRKPQAERVITSAVRKVARSLGWTPRQTQAAVWAPTRHYGRKISGALTGAQMGRINRKEIMSRPITKEELLKEDDVATLLLENYGPQLEEIGIGTRGLIAQAGERLRAAKAERRSDLGGGGLSALGPSVQSSFGRRLEQRFRSDRVATPDPVVEETAADYSDDLDITDPVRREGAQDYVEQILEEDPGQTYLDFNQEQAVETEAEVATDLDTVEEVVEADTEPTAEAIGEVFSRDPEVSPAVRRQLSLGQRISFILRSLVNNPLQSFNIDGLRIASPLDFVKTQLALRTPYQESVKLAFIDRNGVVVHSTLHSVGSLASAAISQTQLAESAREAQLIAQDKGITGRLGLIVAHNHPSGITNPSGADRSLMRGLESIVPTLRMTLADFIITNGETYYSMLEGGERTLPEPHRAPWESVPSRRRLTLNNPINVSMIAATLRQGNPRANFIIFADQKLQISSIQQIPSDFTAEQWAREVEAGLAEGGSNSVYLVSRESTIKMAKVTEKVLELPVRLVDVESNSVSSWVDEGLLTEKGLDATLATSLAEDQAEFNLEESARPATPVPPPPPPPPAAVDPATVEKVISDTGTAPDSAVPLAQKYPSSPVAQWAVGDLDAANTEAIDAEGLAMTTTFATEQGRFFDKTQVFGEAFNILGKRGLTQEERDRAIARASRVFTESGLEMTFDAQNEVFRLADPTTPQEEQGLALIDNLKAELARGADRGSPFLSVLVNSVRNPDGGLWVSPAFSRSTRNRLFALSQGQASFYGLMLGALSKAKRSLNFVAQHVDVYLEKAYSDAFGGEHINTFIDRTRRYATTDAAENLDKKATGKVRSNLDRLDTAAQQGVDLDYYMGQVLDLIAKGERVSKPQGEIAQLPDLFDLANWRLFITQRGGNQLAENILRLINDEPITDNDGAQEGNVKRMDRLLQAELRRIVKEVIPQEAKKRNRPNLLQELMTASGDLQSRVERLEVVDDAVRVGIDEAEASAMNEEFADPDEVSARFDEIREKWDEQFTQISETLTSEKMVNRILNQHLTPAFKDLESTWQDVLKGTLSLDRLKKNVMDRIRKTVSDFNAVAPEAAIDAARSDQLIGVLERGLNAFAADKIQKMRASNAAAVARRKDAIPQRTAENELNRLAQIHSDVQAWSTQEENAVRDAIREQRKNPASPEVFEDILTSLGVQPQTARTLTKIIGKDIAVRRRHEQLRREQRVATPRPDSPDTQTQERRIGIRGLVARIFAAPAQQQKDPRWQRRTALEYFQDNGLTREEAEDAWNIFGKDFNALLKQAAQRGLEQMRQNLQSREERKILATKRGGKQLYQRLQESINAGVFDHSEILREFARQFGWTVPTQIQIDQLKALANREINLSTLSEDERAAIGDDPQKLEAARIEKAAFTMNERLRLQEQIHTLYAQFSRPITLRTQEGRKNLGEAGREFISANMLLKLGFGVKQVIDVGTQWAVHMPFRAIASAYERAAEQRIVGEPTDFFRDVSIGLRESLSIALGMIEVSLNQFALAMKGQGVRRNVEGMRTTISGFRRMETEIARIEAEIGELRAAGGVNNLQAAADLAVKGFILRLMGIAEFALRFTRAMDAIAGVSIEQQEVRERLISELQFNEVTKTPAEAQQRANEILLDWNRERELAMARSKQLADELGLTPSPTELKANAYEILKSRQYSRMRAANLDANQIQEAAEIVRQTVGWNMREETGIGGAIGMGIRYFGRGIEQFGLPLPLGQFSNAIAISINRALMLTPLGYFPSAFGGINQTTGEGNNAWFRTAADRRMRKLEASLGLTVGSTFAAAAFLGLIRVWLKPPDDPEERRLWQKAGHRAGTIVFYIGEDRFIPISLTSGPMSLFRVPLTAIGAVQDMMDSAKRRREKLQEEADRQGVPLTEDTGIEMSDIGAAASLGAFSAIMGGRTAGGAMRSFRAGTERDAMTVKTAVASQASPFLVGLPAFQEFQRMREIRLNPDYASIVDLMFPTQGNQFRQFNFLSDEIGPGFGQQAGQVLSGGSFGIVDPKKLAEDPAYAALMKIRYRPSPIERQKGYVIDGAFRALTDEEYTKAQFRRGKILKELILEEIDPNDDPEVITALMRKVAAISKTDALAEITAVDPEEALQSEPNPERQKNETTELWWEINNLPAEDQGDAFRAAIQEGRVPLKNGQPSTEFTREWNRMTREVGAR